MFGVLARDWFRENLRHVRAEAGGAHEENYGRAERRSQQLHGAGGQPVGDENDSGLHRSWKEGREAADWREASDGRRILHRADDHCGRGSESAAGAGRSVWACAGGDQGEEFRSGARNCEQYGIWIDRRGVLKKPGKNSEGRRDISRRQSLSEPEVHRRDGWSTPVWRIQHVRDGLEGGRERLFAAVHAGQVDRGKSELRTFCRSGVGMLSDPLQDAKDWIAEHEHAERKRRVLLVSHNRTN